MTIYIAEDLAIYREGIQKACNSVAGWSVIGSAADGAEALREVLLRKPDALVLDLSLPGLDGFAIATAVRRKVPKTKIIVLTCYCDPHTVMRIDRIGVDGFVDKNSDSLAQVICALRTAAGGSHLFSSTFKATLASAKADPAAIDNQLSKSELLVLAGIAKGMSDQEIGVKLDITRATAQTHRSRILRKLRIRGTPKLVVLALAHGFGIGGMPLPFTDSVGLRGTSK